MMPTDFFRLQPQLSHALAIRFSNTAVTVEKLANVIKRKKSEPHTRPPGMSRKILGSVIKMSAGPWSSSTL